MSQEQPDMGKRRRVTLTDLDLDRKDVSIKTLMTIEQRGCLPCSSYVCPLRSQHATSHSQRPGAISARGDRT